MEKSRLGGHYLEKYDAELEAVRNRVLAMGTLVEKQIENALTAMHRNDIRIAEDVIKTDATVNGYEVNIDEQCSQILARHQPAARDLRFLISVIKTITDLERIGDQAERVARMAVKLAGKDRPGNEYADLFALGQRVQIMVREALGAFGRMDAELAVKVAREDIAIDRDYEAIMRQQITFMMEDPRTISRALDVLWAIRALERIGDHARNICEYVIYLVKGKDVRHTSFEEMEAAVMQNRPAKAAAPENPETP